MLQQKALRHGGHVRDLEDTCRRLAESHGSQMGEEGGKGALRGQAGGKG